MWRIPRTTTRRAAWPPVALLLIVAGYVIGSVWLLNLGVLVGVVGTVSALWSRHALRCVQYERHLSATHVFAGEQVELTLRLTNDKLVPLAWVRVTDNVPDQLVFGDRWLAASSAPMRRQLVQLAALRPYERVTWRHTVGCPRRGHYLFGPTTLESGDIFGLYDTRRDDDTPMRLVVYPAVRRLEALGFPAGEPFGGRRSDRPLFRDPLRPLGVRDYRPEDSRRHVHWKATARRARLQVKVLETVSQEAVVVVLNGATFSQSWIGVDPERQERVISVAASIAAHAAERGHAIGLTANGSVPATGRPIRVPASRNPDALPRVLEALAAVSTFISVPVTRLLVAESRRAPWGSTLVVVTVLVPDALEHELLRLRRAGRRVALVSLDSDYAGAVPGVPTYHLSPEAVVFGPEAA